MYKPDSTVTNAVTSASEAWHMTHTPRVRVLLLLSRQHAQQDTRRRGSASPPSLCVLPAPSHGPAGDSPPPASSSGTHHTDQGSGHQPDRLLSSSLASTPVRPSSSFTAQRSLYSPNLLPSFQLQALMGSCHSSDEVQIPNTPVPSVLCSRGPHTLPPPRRAPRAPLPGPSSGSHPAFSRSALGRRPLHAPWPFRPTKPQLGGQAPCSPLRSKRPEQGLTRSLCSARFPGE